MLPITSQKVHSLINIIDEDSNDDNDSDPADDYVSDESCVPEFIGWYLQI